jgi:glycosyltransferase involved in cell wall biosynthesis
MAPDTCTFSAEDRGYLAFLGRMSPEKGPDRAIAVAKRAGLPLRMAAKVDDADRAYFRERIQPLLNDPLIEFIGEIGDDKKSEFLGGAKALLFPIDWPEPFGLVMIEAMACGTPVVAYRSGSTPEVIDQGVTGFIVRNEDAAVEAVQAAEGLDRREVRRRFDRRFSATAMARGYLDIYADRLAKIQFAPELARDQGESEGDLEDPAAFVKIA